MIELKNWPTDSRILTTGFEQRWGEFHPGLDIAPMVPNKDGDPLKTVADGKVVVSKINGGGVNSGYGYYCIIQHNGFYSLFGHQRSLILKVGQQVKAGEVIGYMGHTGNCVSANGGTGTHLHLGLYEGTYGAHCFNDDIKISKALDPILYLSKIKDNSVAVKSSIEASKIKINLNGTVKSVPGKLINGKSYIVVQGIDIPLKAAAESLGLNVSWEPKTETVYLKG